MPPKRPWSRSLSRQASVLNASLSSTDAALAINADGARQGEAAVRAGEAVDMQQEIIRQLAPGLGECSRQRLRAVRMGLRKAGSGEARITAKELYNLLQEQQVRVSARTFQLVRELYEDAHGVNYDKLWTALVAAQAKSGRDSVTAQQCRGDADMDRAMCHVTQEERDKDLVSRLAQQMLRHREAFDLEELQAQFQGEDHDKGGKLERTQIMEVMFACTMPVYGAVLHALLNRCDYEQSGQCSWPEMMSLLGRARKQLLETGALTAEQLARLKTRRAEERQAAAARAREQQQPPSAGNGKKQPTSEQLSVSASRDTFKSVLKKAGGETGEQPTAPDALNLKQSFKAGPGFLNSMKSLLKGNAAAKGQDEKGKSVADRFRALGKPKVKTVMKTMVAIDNARQQQQPPKPRPLYSDDDMRGPQDAPGEAPSAAERVSPDPSPRAPRNQPLNAVTPSPLGHIATARGRMDVRVRGRSLTFYTPPDLRCDSHSTDPPTERLHLAWLYGYNGHDSRSNIHVLGSGEILYFTGTVVVLYEDARHQQRHFREHSADITSVAVHSNGLTVASGQQGGRGAEAHVRLWRSDTLTTLHILGMHSLTRAVVALAFSPTQERVVAVDGRPDHVMCAWDSSSGQHLAQTSSGVEHVCGVSVQSADPSVLVLAGREHLGWWKLLPQQRTFQLLRKADYQTHLRARYVTCVWRGDTDDMLTGDSNGTIYVWGRGRNLITNLIKHAHQGSVLCLEVMRGHILTGGRDGCLHSWLWCKQMPHCATLALPDAEGGVRALAVLGETLLIGSTCNSILTATLAGKALRNPLAGVTLHRVLLTQGHYGEVRGLHVAARGLALSTGADGLICLYHTAQRRPAAKFALQETAIVCSDLSSDGTLLAVVTKSSQFCLYTVEYVDGANISITESVRIDTPISKHSAKVVSLSPDGARVAVGGGGGALHVLGLRRGADDQLEWGVLAASQENKEAVTGIDWSRSAHAGEFILRTSDRALRYHLWRSSDLCSLNLAQVGSISWSSSSFKLAFDTIGVYFCKQAEKAAVTSLHVNEARSLVVMGDSHGYLSLFKYPCSKQGSDSVRSRHHSRISHVCFLGSQPCSAPCLARSPARAPSSPARQPHRDSATFSDSTEHSQASPATTENNLTGPNNTVDMTQSASQNSLNFLRRITDGTAFELSNAIFSKVRNKKKDYSYTSSSKESINSKVSRKKKTPLSAKEKGMGRGLSVVGSEAERGKRKGLPRRIRSAPQLEQQGDAECDSEACETLSTRAEQGSVAEEALADAHERTQEHACERADAHERTQEHACERADAHERTQEHACERADAHERTQEHACERVDAKQHSVPPETPSGLASHEHVCGGSHEYVLTAGKAQDKSVILWRIYKGV